MLVRMRLAPEADWDAVRARTAAVFGAVKFSLAARTEPEYDAVSALLHETAQARSFSTFRISANRTDKTFPLTSHDLNVRLGDEIREATGARVDLGHPEADFRVVVGRDDAFVYADDYRGRRRPARRHRREGRGDDVGRHRLAGRRVADDAAGLQGGARALPRLPARRGALARQGEGALRSRSTRGSTTPASTSCRSPTCSAA